MISPLFGWIPDVNAVPRGRMMAIGAGASILFHLLLLLFFIIATMVIPHRENRDAPAAAAPKALNVQLVPMPDKDEIAARPEKRSQLLNARGLSAPEEKPDSNEFESDKDMKAASESPATGLLPLPSQEGRTDIPAQDFKTQDVRISLAKPEQVEALLNPPSKTTNPVSPLYKPQPVAKDQLASAERAKPVDELPEPAKMVKATPPPLKLSDKTGENVVEIAREKPNTKPEPQAKDAPVATPTKLAMATTPSPQRPPSMTERYQESLQKTRIEGNISNRGRAGVNSINTPMGRYHRRMCQQIESLWTLKTREHPELLGTSTVRLRYLVQADGKVTDVQVLDTGGDARHAQICTETIRALKLDPLPPEATPLLSNGVLEMALSFTLF